MYVRESDLEYRAHIFPCLSINGMLAKLTLHLEVKCSWHANVRLNLNTLIQVSCFQLKSNAWRVRETSER